MVDPMIAPLLFIGSVFIVLTGALFNEFMCNDRIRDDMRKNPADYLWYPNKDY